MSDRYADQNLKIWNYTEESYELDFAQLMMFLWAKKLRIIVCVAIGLVCATVYALNVPNQYSSIVIVTPAKQESAGGMGGLIGQLGSLSSLAGLNLGKSGGRSAEVIELLKSWPFQDALVRKYELKPLLYAAKKWDKKNNHLEFDEAIYRIEKKEWVNNSGKESSGEPGSWQSYKVFSSKIKVARDIKTDLITITVTHISPYVAKDWAVMLVKELNAHFQAEDILEAQSNIDYLRKKISETSIADMQKVFYGLIETQTKTLMLAEVSDEYILKTVVNPMLPEEKSEPKRIIMILVGGAVASVFVLIWCFIEFIRKNSLLLSSKGNVASSVEIVQ